MATLLHERATIPECRPGALISRLPKCRPGGAVRHVRSMEPPRTSPCRQIAEMVRQCLSTRTQITERGPRSSVQLKHEAEGFVDHFKFLVAEPPNEFAESLVRYC